MRPILALSLFLATSLAQGQDSLVVHEWGTFTSRQDATGKALGGANVSDELLPNFVYDKKVVQVPSYKVTAASLPDITMRLETPVIYFYPSSPKVSGVRVEVAFPHGWLTEYYPNAAADNPGLTELKMPANSTAKLVWKDLVLAGKEDGPDTTSKIWLAPRAVDATSVSTPEGQRERYLFYRGLARLDSPLRTVRQGNEIRFEADAKWRDQQRHAYVLASFREDGTCAYRTVSASEPDPKLPLKFEDSDHTKENRSKVRELLLQQLVEDGLYPKEAEAMLNTWEHSYFRTVGQRVFFLTPKNWTDEVLPLAISPSAEVTRVMIGRIELL